MQASHMPRGKFSTTLMKLLHAEKSPLAKDNNSDR